VLSLFTRALCVNLAQGVAWGLGGLVGQRHHKSGVVWGLGGLLGWRRVPGGGGLNISTPDNPRGRMSRQHGRRPSSR